MLISTQYRPKASVLKETFILLILGALGVWQLQSDWRLGTVTLALGIFGATILGTAWLQSRRPRMLATEVRYGVAQYEKRSHAALVAAALIAVGSIMSVVGTGFPLLFRVLGALLATCGLWVLLRIARGFHRSTFIRFEPDALWIGRETYRLEIPWNIIRDFGPLGYLDDPAVIMRIAEPARIGVRPPWRRSDLQREELRDLLFVRPHTYGIAAQAFTTALLRHVADVRTRRSC